jgi:hypothetical protein
VTPHHLTAPSRHIRFHGPLYGRALTADGAWWQAQADACVCGCAALLPVALVAPHPSPVAATTAAPILSAGRGGHTP